MNANAALTLPTALPAGSIPVLIGQWISQPANFARLFDAKQLQGGWEVWLQVELAMAFGSALSPWTVVREERNIWPDGGANLPIDLWLTRKAAAPLAVNNTGIELKCRTARENSLTFRRRFIGDVVRVQTAPNAPADMFAIGITDDLTDLGNYDAVNGQAAGAVNWNQVVNPGGNPIRYYPISPAGWGGAPFYLIWRES